MTKFQREALREVRAVPGIRTADFVTGGKHDRIKYVSPKGEGMLIISTSPSDTHAINQIIRSVRRAVR
jgi:hypothetical protein